ncbi:MAG: aromatic amino acid lyase, partial [Tateyamaria sp.]|nr:aromatic amino acid lyase [Tateyamaria sp.]
DSTPTSANQEDHVSMAAHGARRLLRMTTNLNYILGVELLCAAQGVEFRHPMATSKPLQSVMTRLRQDVETIGQDRYLAPDLEVAKALVASTAIILSSNVDLPSLAA